MSPPDVAHCVPFGDEFVCRAARGWQASIIVRDVRRRLRNTVVSRRSLAFDAHSLGEREELVDSRGDKQLPDGYLPIETGTFYRQCDCGYELSECISCGHGWKQVQDCQYEDVFSENIRRQKSTTEIYRQLLEIRNENEKIDKYISCGNQIKDFCIEFITNNF